MILVSSILIHEYYVLLEKKINKLRYKRESPAEEKKKKKNQ